MPQLNRDILREILDKIVKKDESLKDIEKFMMAGKEPFQLVLDYCKGADGVVISQNRIVAKLPRIQYKPSTSNYTGLDWDDEDRYKFVIGTEIPPTFKLIKPISVALASTITSLDVRSFTPEFLPMLKAVDQGMQKVRIYDSLYYFDDIQNRIHDRRNQLRSILEACVNIPHVQDGTTIRLCGCNKDYCIDGMKFFAIPCHKLTIKRANLNTIYKEIDLDNPCLRNIRHFTINGWFEKKWKHLNDVRQFVTFLSKNFPNLETFNADISVEYSNKNYYWDWNDQKMPNLFKALPSGVKGSICYTITKRGFIKVDRNKYHGVEKDGDVYSKVFQVTNNFTMKLITTFIVKQQYDDDDYDVGYGYLYEPGDYVSDKMFLFFS